MREGLDLHVRETAVEMVLETRGHEHAERSSTKLQQEGYKTRSSPDKVRANSGQPAVAKFAGMKMSLLLTAGLVLLAPAVANADSIVYIDQGNVWSAEPDGSHEVQLTRAASGTRPPRPTTADHRPGRGRTQVMARDGQPLHTITTPPAKPGDGGTFAPRPVQLSFSPDGTNAYPSSQLVAPSPSTSELDPAVRVPPTPAAPTATPRRCSATGTSVFKPVG